MSSFIDFQNEELTHWDFKNLKDRLDSFVKERCEKAWEHGFQAGKEEGYDEGHKQGLEDAKEDNE